MPGRDVGGRHREVFVSCFDFPQWHLNDFTRSLVLRSVGEVMPVDSRSPMRK